MKKKLIYLIMLFVGLLVIGSNDVHAALAKRLIYDVTNMNITDDKITFKGWAFYSHENNVGGKSMKISIEATDGNQSIKLYNGGGDGTNQSAYYGDMRNARGRNIYLGRCMNSGGHCVPEAYSTCWHNSGAGDWINDSCIFRQIDFNISFDLKQLKEKFGNNEITFKIHVEYNHSCVVDRTQKTYAAITNKNNRLITSKYYPNVAFGITCGNNGFEDVQTLMGVNTKRVYVNSSKKKNEGTVKIDKSGLKLQVSGISDSIFINSTNDRIQNRYGVRYGATKYFTRENALIDGSVNPQYNDVYQVDLYKVFQNSVFQYGSNIYYNAYALASWFSTNGNVKLKIDKVEEEIVNPPFSSCTSTNTNNGGGTCSWNGGSSDTTYDYGGNNSTVCKTYTSNVYYRGYPGSECEGHFDYINGAYYLKVPSTIKTNVTYTQEGHLYFHLSPNTIHSGGATTFSASYTNKIFWNYRDNIRYVDDGDSVYSPITYEGYTDYETDCDDDGCWCSQIGRSAGYAAIQDAGRSNYMLDANHRNVENAKQIIETFTARDYDTQYLDTLNSSTTISVPKGDIEGEWSEQQKGTITNNRWGPNQTLSSSYTYDIYDAYIDKESGEVNYTSNETQMYADKSASSSYLYRPKNYFIPLDAKTGVYTFEFSISDLSTMRGGSSDLFKWTNTYSCGVNCVQKFYDEDDNGYYFKYRPIDLNDVFPNRNAGVQWSTWMENEGASKVNGNNGNLVLDQPSDKNLNLRANITSGMMDTIREYNQNHEHLGGYLDKSIELDGRSKEFLKDTVGFEVEGGNYRLGCGSLNSLKAGCNN